jgi:hypothetical protein
MVPALATVSDLEERLGLDPNSLVDGDYARAQAALADASTLVRMESRRSWVDDAGAITAPDALIRVVLGAAMRNWVNPDGVIQETVGPFTRRLSEESTGVYLTKAELDIVRRYRPSGIGLWTLQTRRDECSNGTVWCEDSFGFELFPIGSYDDGAWPG